MSRDKPQSCPKIVVPPNSLYCWVLQASFEMVTITAFIFAIDKDRSIFTPSLIILELVASVLEFWVGLFYYRTSTYRTRLTIPPSVQGPSRLESLGIE